MTIASKNILKAFSAALKVDAHSATFLKINTGTDAPLSADPQVTATEEAITGLLGAQPIQMIQNETGIVVTAKALTIRQSDVSRKPTESDRVKLASGEVYNIAQVDERPGLYVLMLSGTTTDPATVVDQVAPTASDLSLSTGTNQFTYGLTASEPAYHKVRYRHPIGVGNFTDTGYSVGLATSIGGTVDGLDAGWYEVVIYLKDAAGNISRGVAMGNVYVVANVGS